MTRLAFRRRLNTPAGLILSFPISNPPPPAGWGSIRSACARIIRPTSPNVRARRGLITFKDGKAALVAIEAPGRLEVSGADACLVTLA